MRTQSINIGIVEDNSEFGDSLSYYFNLIPNFNVLFRAVSVETGLSKFKDFLEIDILVLDIGLPGLSGIEGVPLFKKINKDLDIIILTSYEEEEIILKALCAGACSYISKNTPIEDIAKALTVVYNGGSIMSPSIAREMIQYIVKDQVRKQESILTPRQNEIMNLIIEGNTYGSIAKTLVVSQETIKSHIKNIYKALHVNNKAAAIVKYLNK